MALTVNPLTMMAGLPATLLIHLLLFFLVSSRLLIQETLAQVTQSSYSDHHDDESFHENQIPPPQYQPSEDDVKQAVLDLVSSNIDKNTDGKLSTEELRDWLEIVHQKIIEDNVDRQWRYYEPMIQEVHSWEGYTPEMKEVLNWDHFKKLTYPDEYLKDDSNNLHSVSLTKLLARSQRRWNLADKNTDTVLTFEEFKDFVHPAEAPRMQPLLVEEALEDMDADNDGKITLEKYLKHLYSVSDDTERNDPAWKPTHEGHFKDYLDKNKDGYLDRDELKDWLVPSYNKHEAEAYRLITTADDDKDGELSAQEIATHFHNFYSLLPPEFWHQFSPPTESTGAGHDEL